MSRNTFWIIVIFVAAIVGAMLGPTILGDLDPETVIIIAIVFLAVFIGIIVYSLSANKAPPKASAEQIAATRSPPPAGKGRIYIVRRGLVGAAQGMNVAIDGFGSSQLKSNRFVMGEVDPGTHHISANMARGGKKSAAAMDVAVAEGESVFVDAMLEMGMMRGTTVLTIIDKGQAQSKLEGAKMLSWKPA